MASNIPDFPDLAALAQFNAQTGSASPSPMGTPGTAAQPQPDTSAFNTHVKGKSGTFAELKPIYPSGAVFPLPSSPTQVGINAGMVNLTGGLTCFLQPFENSLNSAFAVYIEPVGGAPSSPVANGVVNVDGNFVSFQIPAGLIREGIFDLFAMVTRAGSVNPIETTRLEVKIDLQTPGGVDPNPFTPDHENLLPATAPALPNPSIIGRGDLGGGVTFQIPAYEGMARYDTVQLSISGVMVEHRLDRADELNRPVSIFVGPERLAHLTSRPTAEVRYNLFDEVKNTSKSSMPAMFIIDNVVSELLAPQLLERNGAGAIDLFTLQGKNTAVLVVNQGFGIGESIKLDYTLYPATGASMSGSLTQQVETPAQNLNYQVTGNPGHTLQAGLLVVFHTDGRGRRSPMVSATLTGQLSGMDFGSAHSQKTTDAYYVVKGRPPLNPPDKFKATYTRQPSGGVGQITYSSSDENVATVDGSGRVVAAGNGAAIITATDSRGARASYMISFSRVKQVQLASNQFWDGPPGNPICPQFTSLTRGQLTEFVQVYKDENPSKSVPEILGWTRTEPSVRYWTGDNVLLNPDGTASPNAHAVDLNSLNPMRDTTPHGGTSLPSVKFPVPD